VIVERSSEADLSSRLASTSPAPTEAGFFSQPGSTYARLSRCEGATGPAGAPPAGLRSDDVLLPFSNTSTTRRYVPERGRQDKGAGAVNPGPAWSAEQRCYWGQLFVTISVAFIHGGTYYRPTTSPASRPLFDRSEQPIALNCHVETVTDHHCWQLPLLTITAT
jgi:hypothetical protein